MNNNEFHCTKIVCIKCSNAWLTYKIQFFSLMNNEMHSLYINTEWIKYTIRFNSK